MRDYQLRVLDDVAACLANLSSRLISPDTSTWRRNPALRITLALADRDGLAVESWLRMPARRFMKVGRIDPSDRDQDWSITPDGAPDLRKVVFSPSQIDDAMATALKWIEEEIRYSSG